MWTGRLGATIREMEKEQLSFGFEDENERGVGAAPAEKYEFAESDECSYCGHSFESENSCRYCMSNKKKKVYLEKQNETH